MSLTFWTDGGPFWLHDVWLGFEKVVQKEIRRGAILGCERPVCQATARIWLAFLLGVVMGLLSDLTGMGGEE